MRVLSHNYAKALSRTRLSEILREKAYDYALGGEVRTYQALPELLAELDQKLGKVNKNRKHKTLMPTFTATRREKERYNVRARNGKIVGYMTPNGYVKLRETPKAKECASCSSLEHVGVYRLPDGAEINLCRKCATNPVWKKFVKEVKS